METRRTDQLPGRPSADPPFSQGRTPPVTTGRPALRRYRTTPTDCPDHTTTTPSVLTSSRKKNARIQAATCLSGQGDSRRGQKSLCGTVSGSDGPEPETLISISKASRDRVACILINPASAAAVGGSSCRIAMMPEILPPRITRFSPSRNRPDQPATISPSSVSAGIKTCFYKFVLADFVKFTLSTL
jgi:hypothetical protein